MCTDLTISVELMPLVGLFAFAAETDLTISAAEDWVETVNNWETCDDTKEMSLLIIAGACPKFGCWLFQAKRLQMDMVRQKGET